LERVVPILTIRLDQADGGTGLPLCFQTSGIRSLEAPGSVRFDPGVTPEAVVAAAEAAGAHEMIVSLPSGYQTRIGESGTFLSAGQCQRVGLARALLRNPFLVVLDEANSNLDHEGERALTEAIFRVRACGGIVIVVAHRAIALAAVDTITVMDGGNVVGYGPKDEILAARNSDGTGRVAGAAKAAPEPAEPDPASSPGSGTPPRLPPAKLKLV